jgi:large subunit ribosomal protein L23
VSIHHAIVRAPSVTEKSTLLRGENKYVFKVDPSATKIEIRAAIEALFDVKVVSINTLNVKGKKKRMGRFVGKRSDWKKALVKLAEGDKIDLFGDEN